LPSRCTGHSPACPAGAMRPTNFTCAPAVGCLFARECDGVHPDCPEQLLKPRGTKCLPDVTGCTPQPSRCNGRSPSCPFAPGSDEGCIPGGTPAWHFVAIGLACGFVALLLVCLFFYCRGKRKRQYQPLLDVTEVS